MSASWHEVAELLNNSCLNGTIKNNTNWYYNKIVQSNLIWYLILWLFERKKVLLFIIAIIIYYNYSLKILILTPNQRWGYPCSNQFTHTSRRWPVNQTLLFQLSEQGTVNGHNEDWQQKGICGQGTVCMHMCVCVCVCVCLTVHNCFARRSKCAVTSQMAMQFPCQLSKMGSQDVIDGAWCFSSMLHWPGVSSSETAQKGASVYWSTAQRHLGLSEVLWVRSVWFRWIRYLRFLHEQGQLCALSSKMLLRSPKLKD